MSMYRTQAPDPVSTAAIDDDYDYAAAESESAVSGAEDALLDLAQLEELHNEAERMKALGNKHMAAQEYTKAYNAYSAALQLAPVGPSSHVFLSNRAAALLSLKRYSAAATDARRAIALAPSFGKAHARLGQALYFQKDYSAAVAAYEDALHYEPDNTVTMTYLEKAKHKLDKQSRKARGEEVSVAESTQFTASPSVATDKSARGLVTSGYRVNSTAVLNAAARPYTTPKFSSPSSLDKDYEEDPDFEEALKIQQRANKYLSNKHYKSAIEEYTAALFLVPDDPNLSPDLHLGRAHALNGSRRHESAKNDAMLAIRLRPTPAAYSTLAKTLFYLRDYRQSVEAFNKCIQLLPPGETLGVFDRAYLQKAEVALEEEEASLRAAGTPTHPNKTPVPKLPPPRFVPREEAINLTPNVPPMPKQWPQQTPTTPTTLRVGPEREVIFLSESLGIKLNRGSDGIVRVLSVTPNTASSPVARKGRIDEGDVIREAAGVDLRRPITNIMWGDTVALIKMAPRPITLLVAKELSEVPKQVREERKKYEESKEEIRSFFPSASSGDQAVNALASAEDPMERHEENVPAEESEGAEVPPNTNSIDQDELASHFDEKSSLDVAHAHDIAGGSGDERPQEELVEGGGENNGLQKEGVDTLDIQEPMSLCAIKGDGSTVVSGVTVNDESVVVDGSLNQLKTEVTARQAISLRAMEEKLLGGEVLFERSSRPEYCGWDNLRWLSYSGARQIRLCQPVFRFSITEKQQLFWKTEEKLYLPRVLVIYDEPKILLLLRRPHSEQELNSLLDMSFAAALDGQEMLNSYWVAESVIDPLTCKLRLSTLTTKTSLSAEGSDGRLRSCFHIITPFETVTLSAVRLRPDVQASERSFSDSGALLETMAVELTLSKALGGVHAHSEDLGVLHRDIAWKHQIVIGTLQSLVLSGNERALRDGILHALETHEDPRRPGCLTTDVIDQVDDNGLPAIYYACAYRMPLAVQELIQAGANASFQLEPERLSLIHICAQNLDVPSLSTMLSAKFPCSPDPNALDAQGRTPLYVAVMDGRRRDGQYDAKLLKNVVTRLEATGGRFFAAGKPTLSVHPVTALSMTWRCDDLEVVVEHVRFRFPIHDWSNGDDRITERSLGALWGFPLHRAVLALLNDTNNEPGSKLLGTLSTLLRCGVEPNERIDSRENKISAFRGYSPLQVLAFVAIQLSMNHTTLRSADIADVAALLVSNGARFNLDAPVTERLRSDVSTQAIDVDESTSVISQCRSSLKIDAKKVCIELLGGDAKLAESRNEWKALKSVSFHSLRSFAFLDDKAVIMNSESEGGSDDKSCAICWKAFGTIMNRKHKCRITRRYVCDDCSSKRVLEDGSERRVSDGQFLLALADASRPQIGRAMDIIESERQDETQDSKRSLEEVRRERLKAEFDSNRHSLLSGVMQHATNLVFGEEENPPSKDLSGLTESLGLTREALGERGAKLDSLSEKTSKMVDASADFAAMAKELRKKSEGGLFW